MGAMSMLGIIGITQEEQLSNHLLLPSMGRCPLENNVTPTFSIVLLQALGCLNPKGCFASAPRTPIKFSGLHYPHLQKGTKTVLL